MKASGLRAWPKILAVASTLALLLMAAAAAVAAPSQLIKVPSKGEAVSLRADQVEYQEATGIYLAKGEVEVNHGETRIFADQVRLESRTMVAEAQGKVVFTTSNQVLTGQRLLVDLQAETGKVYDGQIFIYSNHFYLRGKEIEKTGHDTYKVRQGGFTTCDGSRPAWQITGRDIEVTLEGWGTARHTSFRILDVPVFWVPYMVFPAKFKRQSGFLPTQLGTSDRHGIVISQPYFQTLGESQDATVTLTYMSERGLDYGLEYRYDLGDGRKGMLIFDYLPNDGKAQELYEEGALRESYENRYWFRMKADHRLFNNTMELKADIDLASDLDFIHEFTYGHNGFSSSNFRFIDWFGRELDPEGSDYRENKINIQRGWSAASFNASLIYWDRPSLNNDATIQNLPRLTFDATRQPVGDTGFYFQMASSYVYLYREEEPTGHITDVSPTLSLPLNFNNLLEVEPSFTWEPRLYLIDDLYTWEDPDNKKTGLSNTWVANLKASTYLYRVFDFSRPDEPIKIKHAMQPYLEYQFRPELEDKDLAAMAYRGYKRENFVAYGIDNTFTSKLLGKDEKTGELGALYQEFLRLGFSHSFDLEEYNRKQEPSERGGKRYFGEIVGNLIFDPGKYFYVEAESGWNLYDARTSYLNCELMFSDLRGDSLAVDYYNQHGGEHFISTRLTVAVTKEWKVSYLNSRDLKNELDHENTYEVRYEGQCWGVRLLYTDQYKGEQGWWVAFSLGGFGEVFGQGRVERPTSEN